MSHVATVDVEIKDLQALKDAAKRVGLEFVENQKTYRWFGEHVGDYPLPDGFAEDDLGFCEHALRVPGSREAYEIGVVKRRDGKPGFALMWDFYGGGYGLQHHVGEECNKLRQAYSVAVATKAAKAKGFRVHETSLPNGKIKLTLTR